MCFSFLFLAQMLLLKINLFATEFSSDNIWLYRGMNIKSCIYKNWIFKLQAWTYHPMLNISVIPQRKYNLAPSVINKLYHPGGAKVTLFKHKDQASSLLLSTVDTPSCCRWPAWPAWRGGPSTTPWLGWWCCSLPGALSHLLIGGGGLPFFATWFWRFVSEPPLRLACSL